MEGTIIRERVQHALITAISMVTKEKVTHCESVSRVLNGLANKGMEGGSSTSPKEL